MCVCVCVGGLVLWVVCVCGRGGGDPFSGCGGDAVRVSGGGYCVLSR